MHLQDISCQRSESHEILTYPDPVRLQGKRDRLRMSDGIVEISAEKEKQENRSEIILAENGEDENRRKHRAKNHISPFASLKLLRAVDGHFHVTRRKGKI